MKPFRAFIIVRPNGCALPRTMRDDPQKCWDAQFSALAGKGYIAVQTAKGYRCVEVECREADCPAKE